MTDDKIRTGYNPAGNRMVHHGGSFEHFPSSAWARGGGREFSISAEQYPGLSPAQLEAKCRAMFLNGCGWDL